MKFCFSAHPLRQDIDGTPFLPVLFLPIDGTWQKVLGGALLCLLLLSLPTDGAWQEALTHSKVTSLATVPISSET